MERVRPFYATPHPFLSSSEWEEIDRFNDEHYDIRCKTCCHADVKAGELHAPGKCPQCNCGSSEIVHATDYRGRREDEDWQTKAAANPARIRTILRRRGALR